MSAERLISPEKCIDCPYFVSDLESFEHAKKFTDKTDAAARQREIDERTSDCAGAMQDPTTYEFHCSRGIPVHVAERIRAEFAIQQAENIVKDATQTETIRPGVLIRVVTAAKVAIHSLRA